MSSFNSILGVFLRESKIHYRSFFHILSIFLFFILSIIIFVFAVGSNKELFNQIGVGIIWAIIFFYKQIRKKEGMGLGDAKLLAVIGVWFGWLTIPFVLYSIWSFKTFA